MSADNYDIDDLIGKHLAGEASVVETQQVQEWCTRSAENQKYFENLQLIFQKASLVNDASTYNADLAWRKVHAQLHNSTKTTFLSWPLLRIAASVLLISALGIWAYQQFLSPVEHTQLTSAATVVQDSLPDGTKVALNKQTALSVTYNAKKKQGRIKLKGEAKFEIKHEADKELIVEAEEVLIRDIGTTFNVRAYPESNTIEVTVQEGEVQFYTEQNEGIFIQAGDKGIYNKQTKTFLKEQADTNVVSYATKLFVFEETDLQSVVEQLNAIYEKKIVIGKNIERCRVTVNFQNEEIETIAEILAETLNLRISATASEIILEGEGCE